MNHVKITMPDGNPDHGNTVVEIDGHNITNQVCGFTIAAKVGHFTTVTLDLVAVEYQHEGETRVHLADGVADTLTRLGWTPPGHRCESIDADGNTHSIDWSNATITAKVEGEAGPELPMPPASGGIVTKVPVIGEDGCTFPPRQSGGPVNPGGRYPVEDGEVWVGQDGQAFVTRVKDVAFVPHEPAPARRTFLGWLDDQGVVTQISIWFVVVGVALVGVIALIAGLT